MLPRIHCLRPVARLAICSLTQVPRRTRLLSFPGRYRAALAGQRFDRLLYCSRLFASVWWYGVSARGRFFILDNSFELLYLVLSFVKRHFCNLLHCSYRASYCRWKNNVERKSKFGSLAKDALTVSDNVWDPHRSFILFYQIYQRISFDVSRSNYVDHYTVSKSSPCQPTSAIISTASLIGKMTMSCGK